MVSCGWCLVGGVSWVVCAVQCCWWCVVCCVWCCCGCEYGVCAVLCVVCGGWCVRCFDVQMLSGGCKDAARCCQEAVRCCRETTRCCRKVVRGASSWVFCGVHRFAWFLLILRLVVCGVLCVVSHVTCISVNWHRQTHTHVQTENTCKHLR